MLTKPTDSELGSVGSWHYQPHHTGAHYALLPLQFSTVPAFPLLGEATMKKEIHVCQDCGSEDVQVAMWVNPNTGIHEDYYGSGRCTSTQYCHQCEDHCFVIIRIESESEEEQP